MRLLLFSRSALGLRRCMACPRRTPNVALYTTSSRISSSPDIVESISEEEFRQSMHRSLSHGAMLAVAALWVCAFGVMFMLMSREVKGLRQVVRQKVRGVRGRPRIGRSLRLSDFLAFPRLSTGRPTPRLRRDGIRGTSARGRVATRVRGRVAGTLGGETRDLPRRRKETRVVAHFMFREVHGRYSSTTKNNLARSLFTRRRRPRPSPRS